MGSLTPVDAAYERAKDELRRLGMEVKLGPVDWFYGDGGAKTRAMERADVVFMGFNPGADGQGSDARWRTKVQQITCAVSDRPPIIAELIFISTRNIPALTSAGHDPNKLISLFAPVNRAIIERHRPKLVFQAGFQYVERVMTDYRLDFVEPHYLDESRTRLEVRHFIMRETGTPWLNIRHPSSKGFSGADVEAIRKHAAEICGLVGGASGMKREA